MALCWHMSVLKCKDVCVSGDSYFSLRCIEEGSVGCCLLAGVLVYPRVLPFQRADEIIVLKKIH